MEKHEFSPEVLEKMQALEEKYRSGGQNLLAYLEGLLYTDYLTYWDYIRLDTLMSLQNPRTDYPDEHIFIIYHQITELYFKLVLSEIEQIVKQKSSIKEREFLKRLRRINRYFGHLVSSFDVMVGGMEREQFMKFRMALLPASGFQSVQYRMIEICCTDLINLVDKDARSEVPLDATIEEIFEDIYWKKGATDLQTGEKSLTLKQFEKKYRKQLVKLAYNYRTKNLWRIAEKKFSHIVPIAEALRELDALVNIDWPLSHYGSAIRYLRKKDTSEDATGGTNWEKYLPPKFQRRLFFPDLWTDEEKSHWGKSWVVKQMKKIEID